VNEGATYVEHAVLDSRKTIEITTSHVRVHSRQAARQLVTAQTRTLDRYRSVDTMASTLKRPKKTLRNVAYAAGLLLFAGTFAVAPILMNKGRPNLTTSEKGLTGSQVMRGAYANTGSHDIGPDPDWVNGRYMGKHSDFNPSEEQLAEQRKKLEERLKQLGLEKKKQEAEQVK
jgi:hypothetical protein